MYFNDTTVCFSFSRCSSNHSCHTGVAIAVWAKMFLGVTARIFSNVNGKWKVLSALTTHHNLDPAANAKHHTCPLPSKRHLYTAIEFLIYLYMDIHIDVTNHLLTDMHFRLHEIKGRVEYMQIRLNYGVTSLVFFYTVVVKWYNSTLLRYMRTWIKLLESWWMPISSDPIRKLIYCRSLVIFILRNCIQNITRHLSRNFIRI